MSTGHNIINILISFTSSITAQDNNMNSIILIEKETKSTISVLSIDNKIIITQNVIEYEIVDNIDLINRIK